MLKPVLIKEGPGKYKSWQNNTYKCYCGNEFTCKASRISGGETKSCGCLVITTATKHGHNRVGKRTRAYNSWTQMRQRCNNPTHKKYPIYGGRGIKICEHWAKFENFLLDMGEPAPGTSLDRIDNNKGYEASNCRWATAKVQRMNQRRMIKA